MDGHGSALYDIILNTRKPLVFPKFSLNWKCVECSLDEWCKRFDAVLSDEKHHEFEQMPMKFGDSPQWERYRSKVKTNLTDFLNKFVKDNEKWAAYNYKRLEAMPLECRYDVDFGIFGFPQVTNDASFWLSSKGANTPCHYDTYGCNIVVQIYGSKRWLLFPPGANLTPVRVPYEESSVYCAENFFSPKDLTKVSAVRETAFECTLGEGDVLIVPRNWWHYVESLDTSLSINAWLPLKIDIDAQIEECIVKYIMERSVTDESDGIKQHILNPNQFELCTSSEELFNILRYLLEKRSTSKSEKSPYEYLSETEVTDLINKSQCKINILQPLLPSAFDDLMRIKMQRYVDTSLPDTPIHEVLLNAICHPKAVQVIKDNFLKAYSSRM